MCFPAKHQALSKIQPLRHYRPAHKYQAHKTKELNTQLDNVARRVLVLSFVAIVFHFYLLFHHRVCYDTNLIVLQAVEVLVTGLDKI